MVAPLGIVAGKGTLPEKLIQLCKRDNRPFVVLALTGQAEPELVKDLPHIWLAMGAVEKALAYFRENSVQDLVFVGAIQRPSLKHLTMDKTAAKWIAKIGIKAFGDDGLLSGILSLLEKEGFSIVRVQDVLQDLQVKPGALGAHQPLDQDHADIRRGVLALKTLASLDMGQALIVEEGVILSAEGAEGTSALIKRTKDLQKTDHGGVLVKLTKAHQSHRVDLPTIGPETIKSATAAGLAGIAIEAHATLVLDSEVIIHAANDAGLFVLAIDPMEYA